jgi:hypothetical protein
MPFSIQIEQAGFSLPSGLQSYVLGMDSGKWLLMAGRINGLHGFNPNGDFAAGCTNLSADGG